MPFFTGLCHKERAGDCRLKATEECAYAQRTGRARGASLDDPHASWYYPTTRPNRVVYGVLLQQGQNCSHRRGLFVTTPTAKAGGLLEETVAPVSRYYEQH
jgi:hypothetical protein